MSRVIRAWILVAWLVSGAAQAVNLGEMRVHSSPGEPLHADIELLDLGEVALDEIFPAFAAEEDQGVAGLKHNRYLSSVRLSVAVMADGKPAVKLESERPLFDTFLSFLLEIKWNEERQLREYTALLKLTDAQRQVMEEYQRGTEGVSVSPSEVKAEPAKLAAAPELHAVAGGAVDQDQKQASIVVGKQETLWDIAQRLRSRSGESTQQFMLALFIKNPHAFRNSDINGLMAGSRLQLPDDHEVESVSQSHALKELRRRLAASRLAVRGPDEALLVESGQTLWDLAARTRAAYGLDTRPMMAAIVAANPHAFGDNDPARMLKGVELRMPPLSVAKAKEESASGAPAVTGIEASVAQDVVLPVVEPRRLVVGRQDTLWSIAVDSMPEGENVLGAMIKAIIAKNPHAFTKGDMNSMKVGEMLVMPEWHEVQNFVEK